MKVRFRALKGRKMGTKLAFDLLRADNTHSRPFNKLISDRLQHNDAIYSIESIFKRLRDALTESVQQVLQNVEKTDKQKWITAPIL